MTIDSQNDLNDDEVLKQLYKKGAKDTPPAKLNSEIINYAANPGKSEETTSQVGSHFGGGWKVPLSMAASVVVVFALLVQLDQSPQDLELPPIPEITIPTEQHSKDSVIENQSTADELYEAEEAIADDALTFEGKKNESDLDSLHDGALIIEKPIRTESQTSASETQTIQSEEKKAAPEPETYRDRTKTQSTLENPQSSDKVRIQSNEPMPDASSPSKSKSDKSYAPEPIKAQTAEKKMQAPKKEILNETAPEAASGAVIQQRSMDEKSIIRDDSPISSDMAVDSEQDGKLGDSEVQNEAQVESEFAPIPVEDWLLMIEKLVAQKDYAEAARQLGKFKQAHPKVNVEDLEAKIP